MCAAFGVGVSGGLTYTHFYGLWLNLERARLRQAMTTAQGAGIAKQHGPIDPACFEAIASDQAEARRMEWEANAVRMIEDAKRRRGQ